MVSADAHVCNADGGVRMLCEYSIRILQDIAAFRSDYFGADRVAGMARIKRAHYKVGKLMTYVARISEKREGAHLSRRMVEAALLNIERGIVSSKETGLDLKRLCSPTDCGGV
jgi:hypothetical protein